MRCQRCRTKEATGSCRECTEILCAACMQDIHEREHTDECDRVIGVSDEGICAACVLWCMEG